MTVPSNPAPLTPAVAAGAPVEKELAFHMAKRALPIAPLIILVAGLLRGSNGAWSAALAIVIVVVNLLVAAAMLAWAARISANMLMAVALGGFLVRMLVITGVVWAVQDAPWVDLKTLAVTILVTQLGLLAWECHYVATSLSFPTTQPKETFAP
jgi:hypothetical protein